MNLEFLFSRDVTRHVHEQLFNFRIEGVEREREGERFGDFQFF